MSDRPARTVRWLTEEQARERAALAASGRTREPIRASWYDDDLDGGGLQAVVSDDGRTAVLRVFDVIDSWGGWWGVSASEVADALDALDEEPAVLEVHLNSPGGEALEGVALANILRQHPARVVAIVDGLAASAATMVLTAAEDVVVGPGSQVMVHEASGGAWGDAAYLEQHARSLRSISNGYAQAYAAKAGGTADEWLAIMADETWFAPAEAVAAGLADRLLSEPATTDPAAAVARHDLRVFAHAGRADAPAPRLPRASALGAPAAVGGTNERKDARMSELLNGLRMRLGLDAAADETAALAALDEALAEQAETPPPPPTARTIALPDGHVAVPSVALDELRTQAAQGAAAHEQLRVQNRTAALDGLRDRFLPANRAAWEAEYDRDPAATVAHLQAGPVLVPTSELGHGQAPKNVIDDLPTSFAAITESEAYKNWSMS